MTEVAALSTKHFVVPSIVSTNFHIREGDAVADFGAGSGFFVPILSELVGESGTVYACEIQKNLVETIGEIVRSKNLSNVSPLWCDLEVVGGSKIPTDELDAVIMVNTFFQIEDKSTTLEEVKRVLRKGGKFFVIDWSESFGGLGPHPDQVITEADTRTVVEQAGFTFERTFDAGAHHYGLAFRL